MPELSPSGRLALDEIARRHGFGPEAAATIMDALIASGGGMAQFAHAEFGGSGQWMRGGMTMVGTLSDHGLKARVDALCNDLAALLAREPGLVRGINLQSQSLGVPPGPGAEPLHVGGASAGGPSLFVGGGAGVPNDWWPGELGRPNSSGAQNGVRYAYFAGPRRLAIQRDGRVSVYDTGEHQIGGVSQQQSTGGTLAFTSQHGTVEVERLPVVSAERSAASPARAEAGPDAAAAPAPAGQGGVLASIEKLAELHSRGILTDEEFTAKKEELLARL